MGLSKQLVLVAIHLLFGLVDMDMTPQVQAGMLNKMTELGEDTIVHTDPTEAWLNDLPPFEKHIRHLYPDLDIATHQKIVDQSMERYKAYITQIKGSVEKRQVISLEDSEIDDHMQHLTSVWRGFSPKAVILQGGFFELRREVNQALWEAHCRKFNVPMPELYTISRWEEPARLSPFVYHEGFGIIEEGKRKYLMDASFEIKGKRQTPVTQKDREKYNISINKEEREKHEKYYRNEVERAKQAIRDQLDQDDVFTTIVVKAPPNWLAHVIKEKEDRKEKVAIIWSSAVAPHDEKDWDPRFNYQKDFAGADGLLDLGVPIISVTPALSETALVAIIDKEYRWIYDQTTKWRSPFEGFMHLKELRASSDPNQIVATFLENTQKEFMLNKMEHANSELKPLQSQKASLEEQIVRLTTLVNEYTEKSPRYQELIQLKEKPAPSTVTQDLSKESADLKVNTDLSQKGDSEKSAGKEKTSSESVSEDPWSIEKIRDYEEKWGQTEDKKDNELLETMVALRTAKKELFSTNDQLRERWSRGSAWAKAQSLLGEGHHYRDFGVNDIFVEILLHPDWCTSAVSRVMEMKFERRVYSSDSKFKLVGRPQIGGNFFVPTRVDSTPLSAVIQELMYWILVKEPVVVRDAQGIPHSFKPMFEEQARLAEAEKEMQETVKHSRKRRAIGEEAHLEGSEAVKKSFGGLEQSA